MDILLIQAPCWAVYTPPYNLALLKAVLKQRGHKAECRDLNIKFYDQLNPQQRTQLYENPTNWYQENFAYKVLKEHQAFFKACLEDILSSSAGIIGFTTSGLNSVFSKELARNVKQQDPTRKIIFGGSYCFKSEFGNVLLEQCDFIDAVFLSEAEISLPMFLESAVKQKESDPQGEAPIPGVNFRTASGQLVKDPGPGEYTDINALPPADFSDFDFDLYTDPELPLSTSRGCINRCLFCSESRVWKTYRNRSAENIFAEIKFQKERCPDIRSFYFNDSLINGNIDMLEDLCELIIESGLKINWGGQAAIRSAMSKKLIKKLYKAGLRHVSYGLETASDRILKTIGKNFDTQTAQRVIRQTKQAGIRTDINLVVGFPGENEKDIMQTAKFLKSNRNYIDEIFFHPLAITKGSAYFEHAEKWKICFEDKWNPNSWYIKEQGNDLNKRLQVLDFYRNFIGRKGESFFALPEYYMFIADKYFTGKKYEKALDFYKKAQNVNKNFVKQEILLKKIQQTKQLLSV